MKPKVTVHCVAGQYTHQNERIIEFSANNGTDTGGLISFANLADGTLVVQVYRTTGPVVVPSSKLA